MRVAAAIGGMSVTLTDEEPNGSGANTDLAVLCARLGLERHNIRRDQSDLRSMLLGMEARRLALGIVAEATDDPPTAAKAREQAVALADELDAAADQLTRTGVHGWPAKTKP